MTSQVRPIAENSVLVLMRFLHTSGQKLANARRVRKSERECASEARSASSHSTMKIDSFNKGAFCK